MTDRAPMTITHLQSLTLCMRWRPVPARTLHGFPGPLFRGALGKALHDTTCLTGAPTCAGCPMIEACVYGQLYEPPRRPDLPARFGSPPRPYLVSPDRAPRGWHGARVRLFGDACGLWPQVVEAARAVTLLGSPCEVELGAEDAHGLPHPLTGAPTLRLLPFQGDRAPATARVRLLTPTALTQGGRLSPTLHLPTLMSRLVARADLLTLAYQGALPSWDRALLQRRAEDTPCPHTRTRQVSWKRVAYRSGKRVPMRGLVGELTLTKPSPALWAALRIGELTHVGKDTVFGLGQLRVDPA